MKFFNKKSFSLKKKLFCCFNYPKVTSNYDIQENMEVKDINTKDIFKKQTFTLKELCHYFLDTPLLLNYNEESIHELCNCYLYFSSNNVNYKQFLKNIKRSRCMIKINNVQLSLRSIFQELDLEFSKLIIGIRTEENDYDITLSWEEFKEKIKNCNKELLEKIFVQKE